MRSESEARPADKALVVGGREMRKPNGPEEVRKGPIGIVVGPVLLLPPPPRLEPALDEDRARCCSCEKSWIVATRRFAGRIRGIRRSSVSLASSTVGTRESLLALSLLPHPAFTSQSRPQNLDRAASKPTEDARLRLTSPRSTIFRHHPHAFHVHHRYGL